ncbi:ATP-grasp domain-containing protein [Methylobacterium gossipiicola]|uniref:Predicted ATP-dependent carboligase, ATP-grasp superfamily n=1 Tax=Methylobacterium gossipiicola TaxID=582675 RepID=A0A1I2TY23_9HYPH|nr:Predicted ATP-dependent carboligase, ATP-grasp superfamily [Methylobacterium gossipiicola]
MRPLVLDLFGDADTLALAEHYRPASGRFGDGRLGGAAVLGDLDALAALCDRPPLGIVLGSGFEGAPDLMAAIAGRFRLLGATPEAVTRLKDPLAFADLCARHGIPHPTVTRDPVEDRPAWLLKQAGGSGGTHIRAATAGPAPPGAYFQARVPGRAHALSFLADGRDLAVVGLTEQWCTPSPRRPFRYAGALMRARDEEQALPPRMVDRIIDAVSRLVAATGLRGLASADLLVSGEEWWLTEINPRPGATLDVLDRRPTPLLTRHIAASLGRLTAIEAVPVDAAATEICYAATGYAPMPPFDWPAFVRDRPRSGTTVARDAPLCTLFAAGPDSAATREKLRGRAADIRARLAQTEGPP